MPIRLPSSGFEPENWPALAAKLNADGLLPSVLADGGGRHYIGQLANGYCGTAISLDQFATAAHIAGVGSITFAGVAYPVVQWTSNGDFAIGRIDGRFPHWCEILFTDPGYGTRLVAWGFGKGFSSSRLPFVDNGRNVFPLDDATYALRSTPGRVFRVRGADSTFYYYADDDTGAWTGGDSGGPTFWINPSTGKAMLVGVHGGAEQYDPANQDYQTAFFGQQQTDASVIGRAVWIEGQLTPGVSPTPPPPTAPVPEAPPAPSPTPADMKPHSEIITLQASAGLRNSIKVALAKNRREVLKEIGSNPDEQADKVSFIINAAKVSGPIEDELAWYCVTDPGSEAELSKSGLLSDDFVEQTILSIINEPVFVRGMLRLVGVPNAEELKKAAELAAKV